MNKKVFWQLNCFNCFHYVNLNLHPVKIEVIQHIEVSNIVQEPLEEY